MKKIKGLIIYHDHMEDGEALFTRALLVRAGIEIQSVSMMDSNEVLTAFGQRVIADTHHLQVNADAYDFLVIPGGKYVSMPNNKRTEIKALLSTFYKQEKHIAAICAAPTFLGELGILKDRAFTAFPGTDKERYQGIYRLNDKVVIDGNVITGKSAGTVIDFALLIVETLLGKEAKEQLKNSIKY